MKNNKKESNKQRHKIYEVHPNMGYVLGGG